MLTYAFDLLVLIYEEEKIYDRHDIPRLILQHNLHGLDLCSRAAQLAELALVFKAREKSRRFFQPDFLVRPNITELKDIRFEEEDLQAYFKALGCQPSTFHPQLVNLLHQFEEAKNFGSLIQPCLSEVEIQSVRSSLHNSSFIIHNSDLMVAATHLKVLRVLEQAEALTQRYHVVVANPPYMGGKGMNVSVKRYIQEHFTDYGSDLFSGFIVRSLSLTVPNGYLGFMSPFVWMFISSYEKLRERLVVDATITTLIQLEYSGFDGATVPICTFALQNRYIKGYLGGYVRLSAFRGSENQSPRALEAIANRNCGWFFNASADDFKKIPGSPIVYWLSNQTLASFSTGAPVGDVISLKAGMSTGDNTIFQRQWHEVSVKNFCRNALNALDARSSAARWFPCHSGGEYRKWYGNHGIVVDWKDDGLRIKGFGSDNGRVRSAVRNEAFYYIEGVTWSKISSGMFAARYRPTGFLFDDTGRCGFTKESSSIYKVLALFCSELSDVFLKALCPTLSFTSGEIAKIPFIEPNCGDIVDRTKQCISHARADWDNFETSWDFKQHPLLRNAELGIRNYESAEKSANSESDFIIDNSSFIIKAATLAESWNNYAAYCAAAIRRMQELETENNRLFIAAYGLEGELSPEVPEAQITLARADVRRDMAAFLSYAVGVMFGRYSLEVPGLVLADAGGTLDDYWRIVRTKVQLGITNDEGKPAATADPDFILHHSSFIPDHDGIIPVLDSEWFDDDIAARAKEFLRVTFGEATLEENLRFIENAIGKDLRSYFLTDFYKDHLQTYKNRPIYWLFSSGKQRAFQCLVYLHRYQEGTLARIRTEYAIPLQGKLTAAISRLEEQIPQTASSSARKKLQTELDKSKKQMAELLAYDEQLRSYADQRIALDLDDGVKTNYTKFGSLLAEAKKVCGTKED